MLLRILFFLFPFVAAAATFTVTTANNDTSGSLREAILMANTTPGLDTIAFNVPGVGPHTIHLLSPLPEITEAVTVNGYTQPGSQTNNLSVGNNANIQIVLDGTTAGQADGLRLSASNSVVSGLRLQSFSGSGIVVTGAPACVLKGLLIGRIGSLGQTNARNGIVLVKSGQCVVGGAGRGDRNRIAGNGEAGVLLTGAEAHDNRLQANTIQNNQTGVLITPTAGTGNRLVANEITDNTNLGIDLNDDGVTANDNGDGDDGPNHLQNAPFLQLVTAQGGLGLIRGRLQSAPSSAYHLEFFGNDFADASGFGEGQRFIGQADVATSGAGEAVFFLGLPVQAGQWVTATATSTGGDSSEFSNAELVGIVANIITGPTSQTLYEGDLVALRVFAGGSPPLSYQWYRGGALLPGETNPVLLFPNAQPDPECYTVVVTNKYGSVTSAPPACLTVVPRPAFTQVPDPVSASQGNSAMFCAGVGSEGVTFQWRLNGVNIPGANNGCFQIPFIFLHNQGLYDVVVSDGVTALISPQAPLSIPEIIRPQTQDDFDERLVISGAEGMLGGSNRDATREDGEPNHAGKAGSKSVWYAWTPPVSGIARLSTVGSGFDTLLGVYTGTNIQNLISASGDEDRGGFLNSELRFNVSATNEYEIAVDGFAGASGDFVLSWKIEATNQALPTIEQQPASAVVARGTNYSFAVVATGTSLSYQWFFQGQPLSGATTPTLTISSAQPAQVGPYFVRVESPSGSIESEVASLEIDQGTPVLSADKPEDLFAPPSQGAGGSSSSAFVPVTAGAAGAHFMSNTNATTSPFEPNHCGVVGGASQWYGLIAEEDGLLIVDTIGSDFDTVLAVYKGPSEYTELVLLFIVPVACDNNSAPDGKRSKVCFAAVAGTYYYVAVDGANGARGKIQLNWQLRPASALTETASRQLLFAGSDVILGAPTSTNPTGLQWQKNGVNVRGATNTTMSFCDLTIEEGGDYQLLAATSPGPLLEIAIAKMDRFLAPGAGGSTFILTGLSSHAINLQDTYAFQEGWSNVIPTISALAPYNYSTFIPQNSVTNRFYRLQLISP